MVKVAGFYHAKFFDEVFEQTLVTLDVCCEYLQISLAKFLI